MKVKKHFALSIFVIYYTLSIFLLTACTDISRNSNEKSVSSEQNVKITFAHWSTSSAPVIDTIFEDYNLKSDSKISVNIIKIPSDQVDESLKLMFTSGQGPDIFGLDTGNIELYSSNNWITDLSPYMETSFLSKFPAYAVKSAKSYTLDGKIYTIASIADTYRLIYNRDLFKMAGLDPNKPPQTIQEVRAFAKAIRIAGKSKNVYGFALPAAEDWATYCLAMEYPASSSGLYIFNHKSGKYDLTILKPWLQFFIDMKNDGSLFPGDVFLANDAARKQFAEGNVGMMFSGSWDSTVFDSQFPAKIDWDVAFPPAVDEQSINKGALIMQQGWSWVVNSKTQHMDEAIKIWKFLYSDDFLGELFRNGCILPIVNGITDNPKYQPNLKNFDKYFPTDKESAYPTPPLAMNEASRLKYYRNIFTGKTSVDAGLSEASQVLNTLLEQTAKEKNMQADSYTFPGFDPLNPMKDY